MLHFRQLWSVVSLLEITTRKFLVLGLYPEVDIVVPFPRTPRDFQWIPLLQTILFERGCPLGSIRGTAISQFTILRKFSLSAWLPSATLDFLLWVPPPTVNVYIKNANFLKSISTLRLETYKKKRINVCNPNKAIVKFYLYVYWFLMYTLLPCRKPTKQCTCLHIYGAHPVPTIILFYLVLTTLVSRY